ncbi:MAG: hypothetical protein NZ908_01935 [Candidatus Micrarchaeota archaeon]|nr:hypothetical protein [Candidatus Micrarchaeota archaeon]MCX8154526.1 hypothetical protein [Candidatus Micrarchaeota archaeon]
MEITYISGDRQIKSSDLNEICDILSRELISILNEITSKTKVSKIYLNSKYGYIIKNTYKQEGRRILIKNSKNIIFLKNLPKDTRDVRYLLHFYTSSLDRLYRMCNKKNTILSTNELVSVFPDLKHRRR